ncbi:MFS transporter [Streptomyces clavuligerus]|uniref:Major facilitator superfamily permease n=1 Tax=Streptomyces clavuligerus TaxID=1901 RepID=E2PYM7_STRCL|nr:MFS transporter [Streptomyces clavuligerus]AXU15354.1 MFS transporter [Streptomyces clavuligerus]EFG06249.1 major facilitator superfamily permease [Streptomyces clavuligerus]QCS08130.1 MFS transporter [Streptomyces clavuligerus]QPJ96592.1 MFS transporter [Streptomyces clavuligerus]
MDGTTDGTRDSTAGRTGAEGTGDGGAATRTGQGTGPGSGADRPEGAGTASAPPGRADAGPPVGTTGTGADTEALSGGTRAGIGTVAAEALPALRRRVTTVLVVSQILGGLGVATGIALAAVLAERISGSAALSGLAPTATVAGTALFSMPLAALMTARGRRPGLVLAYAVGSLGAGVVVLAAAVENFPLLLLGMAVFGAGSSANLQARFAAADLALPERRGQAISQVVWATTIGAVLGPNIAAPAGRSVSGLGIPTEAGPFVWAAGVFLVAAVVVQTLLRPDPLLTARALTPGDHSPQGRSLRAGLLAVRESPAARLALATIAVSHTAMVAIMAMTPLALTHHGADIELVGLVISGHIAGMYAFSPVMGRLADRFGRLTVIGLAVALLASAALLAGTAGPSHGQVAVGLFVLGLGWSAGIVAGSALLTDSVPQPVRAAVQGLSDLAMNTAAGVGGVLAGLIVAYQGYGLLNLIGALLVLGLGWAVFRGAVRRPGRKAGPDTTG